MAPGDKILRHIKFRKEEAEKVCTVSVHFDSLNGWTHHCLPQTRCSHWEDARVLRVLMDELAIKFGISWEKIRTTP